METLTQDFTYQIDYSLFLSLSPQKYPLYGLLKQIMVVVGFGINSFVCELIMASKICC